MLYSPGWPRPRGHKNSEARYAFHTIAEMTSQLKGSDFDSLVTLYEGIYGINLKVLVAMVIELCNHFISAMV